MAPYLSGELDHPNPDKLTGPPSTLKRSPTHFPQFPTGFQKIQFFDFDTPKWSKMGQIIPFWVVLGHNRAVSRCWQVFPRPSGPPNTSKKVSDPFSSIPNLSRDLHRPWIMKKRILCISRARWEFFLQFWCRPTTHQGGDTFQK